MENHFTKEGSKREKRKRTTKQPENNVMALISPFLSIITLNTNGLNYPIKGRRGDGWIQNKTKQDPTVCCL